MSLSSNDSSAFIDKNQHLADNILHLMEKKGVSNSDVARALGLPYNTIKRITSGEITDPKVSTLSLIADFLDTSVDKLLTKNSEHDFYSSGQRAPALVPILTWKDLETPNLIRNINTSNWTDWQPVVLADNYQLSKDSFALESRKSMQPRFPQGTVLIIDPTEKPIDGDTVLIKILETNELTFRELAIDPPMWQLLSINNNHEPIIYDANKYQIKGVVILTILHSR